MKHNEWKDSCTLSYDQWLSVAEVDQFKDEVKVNVLPVLWLHLLMREYAQSMNKEAAQIDPDGDLWEDIPESESWPMNCAQQWKNAGPKGQKKMFGLFKGSGIFIGSCCHQMVIAACNIIKSGELYVLITY